MLERRMINELYLQEGIYIQQYVYIVDGNIQGGFMEATLESTGAMVCIQPFMHIPEMVLETLEFIGKVHEIYNKHCRIQECNREKDTAALYNHSLGDKTTPYSHSSDSQHREIAPSPKPLAPRPAHPCQLPRHTRV